MKKSTINLIIGTLLSVSGIWVALSACKDMRKGTIEDTDLKSERNDQIESVDANKDPKEKGLTRLDSAYRSEWVANGFPQTHQELKELEEEEIETHQK